MSRKKKIVIPTQQEVSRYAGEAASNKEAAAGQQSSEPAQSPAVDSAEAPGEPGPESEVERLKSEAQQWREKCLRAKAELANYQRRSERDRAEALRYANAGLVKALLPILDDLERAVALGTDGAGSAEAVVDGVKLMLDNFLRVLRGFEVSPIQAVGQLFDPEVHEAVMQQPSAEHPDKTVLQEIAKGYRLYDRVIRPGKVIVSKPVEGPAANGNDPGGKSEPTAQGGGD